QDYCESKLLVVPPNTLLSEAIALMSQDRHSCILIESQHQIKGIFTERDLIKLIAAAIDFAQLTIAEVMSQQPIVLDIRENLTPSAIFARLKQHKIRHLPVIDAQGKALGVITPNSLRQAIGEGYLLKHRQVEEVMQRQVIHASGDRSISDMAQLMATHKISCVVIVDTSSSGELFPIGIITERDLVQFKALNLDLHHLTVGEVMSSPLLPIAPEATLQSAHESMSYHHIRRLVVADERGCLAGILTQTSILQNLESQDAARVLQFLENLVRQKTKQLTAQKKLQQDQQQRLDLCQHRLQAVLAATSDLVLIVAPKQHSVSVMAEDLPHSNLSNLSRRNLVELTITQFNQPETSQTFYAQARHALDRQQKIEFKYSISLPEQSLWFVAQILPLPDDTVIWAARDLTVSLQTEIEYEITKNELEQLLALRTQQLQSANQLLQNPITHLSNYYSQQKSNQNSENSWVRHLIPLNNALEYYHNRLQRLQIPLWTGAVVVLAIALMIELCRLQEIIVPIPILLLSITVSMSANWGGVVAGLWAHLVWSIYVIYRAIFGFGPATLTGGTLQVTAGMTIMGLFAIVQGWTKEQNRWLAKTLAYLNSNLEQQVRQRTRKLGLAYADLKREMKQHLASKEALAKSEQKFRTIFEHAGVGIVVTGLDKKLLQV
ncbi:MAG: CBS domain-containing protein, partial [Cyanobacteria bacterium P01_A01_bin.83]